MFEGLESFLIVDSTFLLGGGGAAGIFVVGEGAASVEGRGDRVVVIVMFDVEVEG